MRWLADQTTKVAIIKKSAPRAPPRLYLYVSCLLRSGRFDGQARSGSSSRFHLETREDLPSLVHKNPRPKTCKRERERETLAARNGYGKRRTELDSRMKGLAGKQLKLIILSLRHRPPQSRSSSILANFIHNYDNFSFC